MENEAALRKEISELDARLEDARFRLNALTTRGDVKACNELTSAPSLELPKLHSLLLLTDSALPLGTFAFSSGLESFLAHHQHSAKGGVSKPKASPYALFTKAFLPLSISAVASTTLPYLLAAHTRPALLPILDDELDASTPCTVARRASIAQGTALVAVWSRAFAAHHRMDGEGDGGVLGELARRLRGAQRGAIDENDDGYGAEPHGHFAPLLGAVAKIMEIGARDAAFAYLFSHARAVVSAAVRASVLGPYQAQGVLGTGELREMIDVEVRRWWDVGVDIERRRWSEAGQSVPMIDIWGGRHELIYSRIFNS